jgi:hypothetical protein
MSTLPTSCGQACSAISAPSAGIGDTFQLPGTEGRTSSNKGPSKIAGKRCAERYFSKSSNSGCLPTYALMNGHLATTLRP